MQWWQPWWALGKSQGLDFHSPPEALTSIMLLLNPPENALPIVIHNPAANQIEGWASCLTLELSSNSSTWFLVGSWLLLKAFHVCYIFGACLEVEGVFEQRTFFISLVRVKLILACPEVLKWDRSSMNRNRVLFVQIQTLRPSMHHKWKKHYWYHMQNYQWEIIGDQLLAKRSSELTDISNCYILSHHELLKPCITGKYI